MRLNFTFNSFLFSILNTFFKKVVLASDLFLFQVVVFTATNTYTGSTGGNWNTASNWSLGTVPTSTDDVVIPSGKTVVLNVSSVNAKSVTVSGEIEIPSDSNISINSLLIVVTSPSGRIFFNKKSIITLPQDAALYLQNGSNSLDTSDNGVCSNNTEIHVGTTNYAVCTGGGALYSFDQVETAGGINVVTAGEIGSSQNICSGFAPNGLTSTTAATGAGTKTYEWETNASGNYVTILGATSETYSPPVLNTTTSYRRRTVSVINGQTFYSQYTSAVTITVNPASVGGSIAGSTSVCAGTNNSTLTLNGYTGSVVKWQSSNSSSFSSSVTDIANTTTTLIVTNLAVTTYYRAVVANGTCSSANSSIATITVAANNTVSTASLTSALCFNTAMPNITHATTGATGIGSAIGLPTGVTASWSSNTITISGTPTQTGTFNYSIPLTGGCGSVNATGVLTVNSLPNNITNGFSATTICAGGSPQLTFDAEDATFSMPYSITYKNDDTSVLYTVSIPYAAPYSFTPGDNPTSNTGYTLVSISNATCVRTSGFANPGANLIVRPIPTATVSGTTSVCVGASSPNITFTNPQTVAITITYNINGGTNQTVNVAGGGNSSTNVAVSTASAGDFVYNLVSVVYQSTPNCSNTLSGSATVTVNSNSVVPTSIIGTTTICSGDSITLTLSGGTAGTGAVAKWYSGSCGGTLVGTGSSINVSPTSTTTYFVRYEGTCNTTSCASATVTVNDNNTVSEALSSPILCANATMTNVTHTTTGATGIGVASNLPAGVTASWASNTITITGVPTELGTFNYNIPLTGGCGNVSATGTIVVNPLPTTPTAGTPTNPTCTRPTGSVPLSGLPSSGTIVQTGYKEDTYAITGGGTQTISGLLPGTYYFAIDNGSCVSGTVTVVIIAPVTNTWSTGSWSDGTPTINQRLVFASDYTNANDVDIEGCSCQVTGSTTVTIKSGRTLKIENGVEVQSNAKLIFENDASLVQMNDAAVNSGNINYHRHTGFVKRYDFTYWSSPVAGQTLKALSPNTLYDKYYSYNPTSGWKIEYNGAAIMEKGRGYIIRAPQTFSITVPAVDTAPEFVGVPNNGLVSYAVLPNLVNLVGNPYPSAVDADKFIAANSASLEGTLYFWTHNTSPSKNIEGDAIYNYTANDYFVYNKTGGVGVSGKIAAGQSFFAPSSTTGGTVLFNNAMRYTEGQPNYDNSQFYKLGSTSKTTTKAEVEIKKSRIWLNLTNKDGAYKQMLVGYIDGATNNYDAGFDGVTYDGNQFVDFYSVNNAVNLAIQGRALPFVKQDSIVLGYKSTIAGDFQISIDHADGVLETQNVFLEDKTLNVLHDLRKGAYTFTTAKGVFNNRFILRYVDKNAVEEVAAPVVSEELSNEVVASVKDGVITVNSTVGALKTVVIYDVSGGILYQKDNVDSNELVIQQLISSHQVLVITIVLSDGTSLSRKVIY